MAVGLVKLRFEVANEVQLSRAFETSIASFLDLRIPFGEMVDDFYLSMTRTFAAEGAKEGKKMSKHDLSCGECEFLNKEAGICNKYKMILEEARSMEFEKCFPCRNPGARENGND